MQSMMPPTPTFRRNPADSAWCRQIFASRAAREGGVVRRSAADVEREIGRDTLELEVRRRGFHMVECGGQLLVICTRDSLRVIC